MWRVAVAVWLCAGVASAEVIVEAPVNPDAGTLSEEIKAQVPAFEGLDVNQQPDGSIQLHVRCLKKDCTKDEVARIRSAVAAHDPFIKQKQAAAKAQTKLADESEVRDALKLTDEQFQKLKQVVGD